MKRLIALVATLALGALSFAQNAAGGKNLIVYFSVYGNQKSVLTDADSSASRTLYKGATVGNTEAVARMIQEEAGGDLVRIETVSRFSDDVNKVYDEGKHTKNTKFKATKNKIDLSKYDTVFIGFPAWWYDMPDPIFDFLDKHDLSGKQVYVFATSGGSGLMRSISEIQKAEPKATPPVAKPEVEKAADEEVETPIIAEEPIPQVLPGAEDGSSGVVIDTPPPSPGAPTHVVQDGEDIVTIAIKYKVSPSNIVEANSDILSTAGDTLNPGMVLKLPSNAILD